MTDSQPASPGFMLGWHEDGDDVAALERHEKELGKPFAVVRLFRRTWGQPGQEVDAMVGQGRPCCGR